MPRLETLLAWYDARRRDLPWRAQPVDPYRVWVSEIMLQQTRVETVIDYYLRFLERFPTVVDLANASIDEVLALWAGLGYYARGRNLHAAARKIRDDHAGRFPSEAAAVRALPGIGRYTAGAILSIAFGQREALVDGNVVRVLARTHGFDGHAKEPALAKACWELAETLVPAKRPGDFNQALMELGATVCVPANPACEKCPLAENCVARATGRQAEIPAKPPRKNRPHRRVDCAFVERGGRVLLVRRPEDGLLGGLWEMPSAERKMGGKKKSFAAIAKGLGLPQMKAKGRVAVIEHVFSHFEMTLEAWACEASGEPAVGEWVAREELANYGMGAAMKRALDAASRDR